MRARARNGATAMPPALAALEAAGVSVASVTMARPSLDDVYLRHAGRSFRRGGGGGMIRVVRHSAYITLRYLRAFVRQPAWVAITLIQPMIWLLLFGALFKRVVEIPGFTSAAPTSST